MKEITLSLLSICLLIISIWLFYTAKTKRKKVEFTYEESSKSWLVLQTNCWMVLKKFARNKTITFIIILILVSVLTILSVYYFFGTSVLGVTFAIVIAIWGAIGSGLFLGSTGSDLEISSGAEDIFKILKKTVETFKETLMKSKPNSLMYSGYVELPRKIYVDEAEKIEIYLEGKNQFSHLNQEYMSTWQIEELSLIDIHIKKATDKIELS